MRGRKKAIRRKSPTPYRLRRTTGNTYRGTITKKYKASKVPSLSTLGKKFKAQAVRGRRLTRLFSR